MTSLLLLMAYLKLIIKYGYLGIILIIPRKNSMNVVLWPPFSKDLWNGRNSFKRLLVSHSIMRNYNFIGQPVYEMKPFGMTRIQAFTDIILIEYFSRNHLQNYWHHHDRFLIFIICKRLVCVPKKYNFQYLLERK